METVPNEISGLPRFSFYTMDFKNEEGVTFLPPTQWNAIYDTLLREDVSPTIRYKQLQYKQKPQRQSDRSLKEIMIPLWKDNQSRRRRSEESMIYGKYSKKRNRLELFSGNTKIVVSKPNVRIVSLKHMRKSSLNNIYFAPELTRKASFNLGPKQSNKLKLDIAPLDDEMVRKINLVVQGKPPEEHKNAQTLRKLLKRKTEILKIGQMFGRGTKIFSTMIGKTVMEDPSETPITTNQECKSEYQTFQYPSPTNHKLSLHRRVYTQTVQNKGSTKPNFVSLNKQYPLLRQMLTSNKILDQLPSPQGKRISQTPLPQSQSSNQSINRTLQKSVHQQLKKVDKALRHSKTKSTIQDRMSPNIFCKTSFRISARGSTLKCASQHYGADKSQISSVVKLKTKLL